MANVKGGRYVDSLYFPIVNPNTSQKHYPSSKGNWRFNKETIEKLINDDEIYFGNDGKGRPKLKRFLCDVSQGVPFPTLWDFLPENKEGSAEMAELFGSVNIFDTAKPTALIKEILRLSTSNSSNDIVLDFFAGSGTTAHAVLDKNKQDGGDRKFICVQLPESIDKQSQTYKEGFKTIADICKERIRRVIKIIEKEERGKLVKDGIDLGFKVFRLEKSSFKIWDDYEGKDPDKLRVQIKLFSMPLIDRYKDIDVIYESLIKGGFDLNSKIEKLKVKSNTVYKVIDNGNYMLITLDPNIRDSTVNELDLTKENTFICLDSSLTDSQKTNLSEQCQLRTI